MLGLFRRARIRIRTRTDGTRDVRVSGRLASYGARIAQFVADERIPDGSVTLTMGWRYRFRGFDPTREQQMRNFLAAECKLLPASRAPGRRAVR